MLSLTRIETTYGKAGSDPAMGAVRDAAKQLEELKGWTDDTRVTITVHDGYEELGSWGWVLTLGLALGTIAVCVVLYKRFVKRGEQ